MHVVPLHVLRVSVVRGKDNRSGGRRFGGEDCAVQGVLVQGVLAYFGCGETWGGDVGGFKVYGRSFGVGCDGLREGVGWVRE